MAGFAVGGHAWPEPLSPIFREGGALAGVNEDLALILTGEWKDLAASSPWESCITCTDHWFQPFHCMHSCRSELQCMWLRVIDRLGTPPTQGSWLTTLIIYPVTAT